ncbi:MAG: hypothetical protein EBT82_02420 [Micrococcales bacterium]|nr:hypothetical protein [Micrococcales bacterium]NBR54821.1 hypothetical protein [Micrococcales bacterium]
MNNRLNNRYNQTKTIKEIPIEVKPNHYYKVNLFYSKGGLNYFTYKQDERGYYLSVKAVEKSQGDGYEVESYVLFNGVKQFIKSAKRFSQSVLDELASKNYDQTIAHFIKHIEDRNQHLAV